LSRAWEAYRVFYQPTLTQIIREQSVGFVKANNGEPVTPDAGRLSIENAGIEIEMCSIETDVAPPTPSPKGAGAAAAAAKAVVAASVSAGGTAEAAATAEVAAGDSKAAAAIAACMSPDKSFRIAAMGSQESEELLNKKKGGSAIDLVSSPGGRIMV
jgi:hypothetical protein